MVKADIAERVQAQTSADLFESIRLPAWSIPPILAMPAPLSPRRSD